MASVALSVADDGVGVPAERLPHLFRKFSRIDGEDRGRDIAGSGEEQRQKAKLLGKCQNCSKPAIPGQTRCFSCAEQHRQSPGRSYAERRAADKETRRTGFAQKIGRNQNLAGRLQSRSQPGRQELPGRPSQMETVL